MVCAGLRLLAWLCCPRRLGSALGVLGGPLLVLGCTQAGCWTEASGQRLSSSVIGRRSKVLALSRTCRTAVLSSMGEIGANGIRCSRRFGKKRMAHKARGNVRWRKEAVSRMISCGSVVELRILPTSLSVRISSR